MPALDSNPMENWNASALREDAMRSAIVIIAEAIALYFFMFISPIKLK